MKQKNVAEIFAQNIFNDSNFQEKWKQYLEKFGEDINTLFPEKYRTKVLFASILQKICDENFEEAFGNLEGLLPSCSTEEETKILARLMDECEKKILPKKEPQKSERCRRYRETLLSNGFLEANRNEGHFFRKTMENTAFIINLEDEEDCVTVVYGYAAIPSGTDGEEWFAKNGADNDTCHVRNILCVWDEKSETEAAETVSAFYHQYKTASKDEILALKKEREKAFLAHFAVVLKPLGFKKKRTKWTKELDGERALSFEAQKSAYSDQYYFNVSVHSVLDFYERKSYERVVMYDSDIYNWQLMTKEQIENLVQCSLEKYIEPELKKWSEKS
ncbi:MAG: DUF4304 domain-containing protein [Ruminococcaceae bacterium]|nr:DUF4304 domain-containing protein [Oscillospiraceae bacterium]